MISALFDLKASNRFQELFISLTFMLTSLRPYYNTYDYVLSMIYSDLKSPFQKHERLIPFFRCSSYFFCWLLAVFPV